MKYSSLLFLSLFVSVNLGFAQSESDEFDLSEPAFEVNSSKEDITPEEPKAEEQQLIDDPSTSPFQATDAPDIVPMTETAPQDSFDLGQQKEEETVTIRTREDLPTQSDANETGLVEVRMPQDVFLPYKQRQNKWGFLFSGGAEMVNFPKFESRIDGATFKDLVGSSGLTMMNLEFGPKYNFRAGSIAALLGLGFVSKEDDNPESQTTVTYTRYTLSALYYLDMLSSEPYFVPYVGGGAWQASYSEDSAFLGLKDDYSSKIGMQWRVGALIGLDWIEEDNSRRTRRKTGMQGTFLNVYMLQTTMSESNTEVNLENNMDIGASLVVEF